MQRTGGTTRPRRRGTDAILGAALAVTVLLGAGCGDDGEDGGQADEGSTEEFCAAFADLTESDPYADYEAALEDGDGTLTDEAASALREGLDRIIALRALAPDEVREATTDYVRAHEEYAALIADLDGSSAEDAARIGTLQAEQQQAETELVEATVDLCA